jgi:RHS repeat-associated protein
MEMENSCKAQRWIHQTISAVQELETRYELSPVPRLRISSFLFSFPVSPPHKARRYFRLFQGNEGCRHPRRAIEAGSRTRWLAGFFLTLLLTLFPLFSQAAQNISIGSYTLVSVTQVKKQLYYYNYRAQATNQGNDDAYQVTAVLTPEAIKRFRAIDSSVSFGTVPVGAQQISTDQFTLSGDNKTPPSNLVVSRELKWIISSNTRPIANAGADQTVLVGETVALNGSGSTDGDGDSLTYAWTLVTKPTGSQALISSPTAVNPSFLVDKPGEYVLQLIVNDGKMDSSPGRVTISTRNSAPVAQAGPDQTTQVGVAVTLDGSGSTDADGDPLTYRWTLPVKPSGSQASLNNSSAISPMITPDRPGIYEIELIVNDGQVDSAPDRVTINTENSKPVANAGVDQVVQLGQTVTLDGGASHDVDGDPLSFKWSLTTRPSGSTANLTDSELLVTQFTPDQAGLYVAQLIVNDSHVDSVPDTAQITVEVMPPPPNHPPQITSTPVIQAILNQRYQYDVDANDIDGDLLSYSLPLSAADMLIDPVTGLIQWTPTSTGTQPVTVKVDDGQGGTDNQSFNITVSPAGSQQVTVPPLTGLTRSAAETAIQQAKLTVGSLSFQHDATTASGIVLSQSLASGTQVDLGIAVNLSISLGPDNGLPPDPAVVAPNTDATVATTTYDSTKFLYSGDNPIQTGVAPGTIEPVRAALIRGKVLDKQNNPLAGVVITILNHPEFGQTQSRADGMFDMVVNGGGELTLNYGRNGYLSVQRHLNVLWQAYDVMDDVVMILQDAKVSTIDLTAVIPMQVAQGSLVDDGDGPRQAMLMIPGGTKAQVYNTDGTLREISTLTLHLTEYTVGSNGPATMPGPLPPSSAYTYAVELKAEEGAIKKDGKDVVFDRPIPFYVDNFLNFPVGTPVPVGYYDAGKKAWIPHPNGRTIKILSITGGLADIDTDGDNVLDDAIKLAALGITNAERTQLATTYSAGKSLWRMQINHLSTWDCNWPYVMPKDAVQPTNPAPTPDPKLDYPICSNGSIVECENQVLGESTPVIGTSHNLNYRSDRVPGRKAAFTATIPVSGATLPPTVRRIDVIVEVAGRKYAYSLPAQINQKFTFDQWDGRDAFGRLVQGRQTASVKIGYVYDPVYATPAEMSSAFGRFSGVPLEGNSTRNEVRIWQYQEVKLGVWSPSGQSLGGWTLDQHHTYDLAEQTLYLGNGSRRSAQSIIGNIKTITGNGIYNFSGDGGAAIQASFRNPTSVAFASDGTMYIADWENHRIRRVGTDGVITTIAGTGVQGFSGDGGPALQARLNVPTYVLVAPDGSLYISDQLNHRVRRINTNGIITTVAGNGVASFSGDGGPATQASLWNPTGIALASDGTLYIGDWLNHRVRQVSPDGVITTVAGTGVAGFTGDGGPATQARLFRPNGVTLTPDGDLLVTEESNNRIRRIGPDGIISTIAGNGIFGFSGDGGLATQAALSSPINTTLGSDGSLYITDTNRIRRVAPDGYISTIAGTGVASFSGDGGPAMRADLRPSHVIFGPENALYITDWRNNRIRRVNSSLPGYTFSAIAIPSEDGSEIYHFDSLGRHQRTVNALTGATLLSFAYDSKGRLASITDAESNLTVIERDVSGTPTAIIAPFGQRTTLTLDANGYLANVINPANESYQMTYTVDGLLTSFKDPKGNASAMTYDTRGRLTKDQNAAGGSQSLTRTESGNNYEVTRTSGLNRTTRHRVEALATGDQKRTSLYPDGTKTETLTKTDGTLLTTASDGTITTLLQGPDPRFSMQAPIAQGLTVQTGGLTSTLTTARTAILSDSNNPLSLTQLTDTVTLNGRTATSVYDAATRAATATSAAGRISSAALDNLGRVVQSQVTGLLRVNTAYDLRGRLESVVQGTGADQRTLSFAYNPQGYLETVTDPLGRAVGYEYDLAGRVTRQIMPDNREILYSYDANGNLSSLTPPGRPAHVFRYTNIDQTEEYVPPDVGAGTNSTLYEYDLDKALTKISRPDGLGIDFVYDSAGRLSTQTTPEGATGYTYDPTTGKLTTVTAPAGSALNFTYNGALLTQTDWTGEITGNVGFSYDNEFRVTGISVNGANPIMYQYDADSFLTQAGDLTLSRSAQNGLLTGTSLGTVSDSLSYDGFGEVTQRDAKFSGASFFKTDYSYDKLSRITRKVESIGVLTNMFDYGYDPAGRLVEVMLNGTIISSYTYDANGNRLTHAQGGNTDTGIYDAQDRLLTYGGASYTYTANGELKSKTAGAQTTSYDYDVLGNLRKVTLPDNQTIDYVIDAANRRVGKKVNGTLMQGFLYQDQLKPIAELDGTGNIVSRFVYATRANVPDYMVKGGQTYRIVTDHLGSPRFVVNMADGSVVQQMEYDEFGNVIADTAPGFQPFGFAGGLYDRDTRLVRFGARDYEAETGRWVTKDPILFGSGSTNFLAYANSDPINLADFSGLSNSSCWDALHTALDVAGIADPTGVADVTNAAIYASEGDWSNVGISMLGIIPYVGDSAKVLKYGAKAAKAAEAAKAAKATTKSLVDLTEHRAAHILNRHRSGAGIAGKTEFPASWSDEEILHHVSDVATDPKALPGVGKWDSPYAIGTRDGVNIRVDFYPPSHPEYAGKISTAYPLP